MAGTLKAQVLKANYVKDAYQITRNVFGICTINEIQFFQQLGNVGYIGCINSCPNVRCYLSQVPFFWFYTVSIRTKFSWSATMFMSMATTTKC